MRSCVWIILSTILIGGCASGGPALRDPRSLNSAAPEVLAAEALAIVAPQLLQVTRPAANGELPYEITFATTPRGSGNPGICEATEVTIVIRDQREDEAPLSTRSLFKVVGDTTPLPDTWNEAYDAKLEQLCRSTGRVVPETTTALRGPHFFSVASSIPNESPTNNAWFAAHVLNTALKSSDRFRAICVTGTGVIFSPTREPSPLCGDINSLVSSLDPRDLFAASVVRTTQASDFYTVTGTFRSDNPDVGSWGVEVMVDWPGLIRHDISSLVIRTVYVVANPHVIE